MANIQYIGARYVPKFYENPDDSSNDWKSGVSYEPLTVVTYLDDSYTSKIAVPASVGNPANNPIYWVKTGNYNAALTALLNRVSTLENDILEINGRPRYIFIGDSYAIGTNAGVQYGWLAQVKTILGLTEGDNVFSYGVGGYGFIGNVGTFEQLLDNAINDISDKDTITDIFVAGGYNDYGDSGIGAAIDSFCNKAHTNFKHAKITIAFNGAYNSHNNALNGQTFLSTKYNYTTNGGKARIVTNLYDCLLSDSSYMGGDGIHPTISGYNALAIETAHVILGGNPSPIYPLKNCTFAAASEVTEASGMQHYWRRSSDEVRFWFISFYMTCAFTSTGNTNTKIKLGTLSNCIYNPVAGDTVSSADYACHVRTSDNVHHACNAQLSIDGNGDLYIRIPIFKSDGTRYLWSEIALIEGVNSTFAFPINQQCV